MTDSAEWNRKGATLSDKTTRKEYGLSQEEIYAAIDDGELQYRQQAIHGNPFLRLLRREVEALVAKKRGSGHLRQQQAKTELAKINRELRQLRSRIAELEERKAELTGELGG